MKIGFKNRKSIINAIIVTCISHIIFSIFARQSMHNGNSLAPRILAEGSFCLIILLYGFDWFIYKKQKGLGCFLWLICGLLLFQMVESIIISGGI